MTELIAAEPVILEPVAGLATAVVVGIGDPQRRDEGVGPAVVDLLAGRDLDATLVSSTGETSALVNILLPVVHPRMGSALSAAGSSPLLEPPGFLMLNYGRGTPIATLLAHIADGAIVGGFVATAVG